LHNKLILMCKCSLLFLLASLQVGVYLREQVHAEVRGDGIKLGSLAVQLFEELLGVASLHVEMLLQF